MWIIIGVLLVAFGLLARTTKFTPTYKASDFAHIDYTKVDVKKCLPHKQGGTYAVIGTGFVGKHIISQLLLRGEENIKAIDVVPCKEYQNDKRVQVIKANVLDLAALKEHLHGVDVVFSTFAIIKYNHRLAHEYKISYDINVVGTENVIKACIDADVNYLIQTSTSYVSVGFGQTQFGMDERSGYAKNPFSHYGTTKSLAEERVLTANGSKTKNGKVLITGSIRPCSLVFGFEDPVNCSNMFREEIRGFFVYQKIDYVFVENVAYGHLLLETKMRSNPDLVGGECFNIGQDDPISRHQWYSVWKALYPECRIVHMSDTFCYILAYFSEFVQLIGKGKLSLGQLDLLTPATVATSFYSHSFSSSKASKFLGYKPLYSTFESIQKTIALYVAQKQNKMN